MRLDQHVAEHYPQISRSYVSKLIDEKQVLVNSKPSKPGYRLREGDKVTILFDLDKLQKIEDIDLPIIYQDDNVLVIDKPVGVISHSRGKYWYEPSVASFVRQITGQDGDRAGIVHRLDRATSGVMICAKNHETLSFLQKQFNQRKVKKVYHAVVTGTLSPPRAIIEVPIGRNPAKPQTFRPDPDGKQASTEYSLVNAGEQYSLVKLMPITGRTHQLRVHLKHINRPIVGDELYGGQPEERLFLHASELEITLPGGKRTTFSAPLPEAFARLVN